MSGGAEASARVGAVRLAVADLDRALAFYERALGLSALEREDGVVRVGVPGRVLVELQSRPGAPPPPAGSSGLFHLALLLPERRELARAVRRVAAAGATLTGASDHLVSEAVYLADPEGNGVELYRDRPRAEWPRTPDGLRMDTLPLDLRALLAEPGSDPDGGTASPRAVVGHVHLKVADLAASERFYHGVLGLDVTVRSYPGALFVAAGGYHHHVGLNTWFGSGAPPPPGSRGLEWFELLLPDEPALGRLEERLAAAGVAAERADGGIEARDPSGNRIRVGVGEAVPAS
jgi:catechol 2,3-dioxygenase